VVPTGSIWITQTFSGEFLPIKLYGIGSLRISSCTLEQPPMGEKSDLASTFIPPGPIPFHSAPAQRVYGRTVCPARRLSPATDLNIGAEKPTGTSVTAFIISSHCVTPHSYRSFEGSVFTTWVRSHPPMSTTFLTNLWTGAFSPRKTNRASTLRAWQGLTT
jgi:hypothetical protein